MLIDTTKRGVVINAFAELNERIILGVGEGTLFYIDTATNTVFKTDKIS